MKYHIIAIIFMLLISGTTKLSGQSKVLSIDDFMSIVKKHHPVSFQADLALKKGAANLQMARGSFDPKTYFSLNQKYYDGKQYYSYLHGGLKIPTWFGLSVQGGYTQNRGYFLNSESTLPEQGLVYLGISANLGQGLFIDKRRAELNQAKIFLESSKLEQILILNYLYFEAKQAYWSWWQAYNKMIILQEAVNNARIRLDNIRQYVHWGDKPAVDTLKVFILLQNRQVSLVKARVEFENETRRLETFLWQDGIIPLEIDSLTTPEKYKDFTPNHPPVVTINDSLVNNHPAIRYLNNNLDIAKIEYRLSRENLKPQLEVKYNLLTAAQTSVSDYTFNENDYKLGITASYPLFTRKERGKLHLTKIKMQETEYKLNLKRAEVKYKITATINMWSGTYKQVQTLAQVVENYHSLLQAELQLFSLGESSMFMVNFREQQYIDAQLKLISLIFKNQLSKIKFEYQSVRI